MEKYKVRALIVLIINIARVNGFDIVDHRDVGDLRNPVRTDSGKLSWLTKHSSKIFSEAQPVDLECGLRFNPGSDEKWTTCKWTKIFRDIPADWVSHTDCLGAEGG